MIIFSKYFSVGLVDILTSKQPLTIVDFEVAFLLDDDRYCFEHNEKENTGIVSLIVFLPS